MYVHSPLENVFRELKWTKKIYINT